jgi:hypothetical protein
VILFFVTCPLERGIAIRTPGCSSQSLDIIRRTKRSRGRRVRRGGGGGGGDEDDTSKEEGDDKDQK